MTTPKPLLSVFLFLIPVISVFAQVPVDNAYRSRFNINSHWTDSLRWTNVTQANTISNLVAANKQVDSLIMQNTMNQISIQGGGVLYFAADTFRFGFD